MPIGVIERLTRGAHRKNDEVVDLALVLWLHPLVWIEGGIAAVAPRNHAGDLARQIRHIERVDLFGAALAIEDPLPGRFDAATEWRHHAEACDDNSSHVHQLQRSPPAFAQSRSIAKSRWIAQRDPAGLVRPARALSSLRSFRETSWRRRRSKSSRPRRQEFRNRIPLRTP